MSSNSLDLLRAKAQKRKELLAQSLGANSIDHLSQLLGSSEEKKNVARLQVTTEVATLGGGDKTPSSTTSKKELTPQPSTSPTPKTLPQAFVVAKVQDDTCLIGDKDLELDEKEIIEDVAKVAEEEFCSSAAFLKGTQSLNPHNDYSQNYVDTRQRPQNFIRDPGLNERFEEYPKLKELIRLKDNLVETTATPPMSMQCDLKTYDLSQLNTRFDVILIEPTLAEYQNYHNMPSGKQTWNWDEIENLDIPAIAESRCFVWLWAGGTPEGTNRARQCLRKWGFRRCEDICWVKCNANKPGKRDYLDADQAFNRTKEHCLMGIKGTVRRSVDGDFIHANVDIDLIITEQPGDDLDPRTKPDEIFLIAEHFCLGRRRLHIFGRDDTLRRGWVSIGPELTSSYFEAKTYRRFFEKQPGCTTGCTSQIECLRPKSPERPGQGNKKQMPNNNNQMKAQMTRETPRKRAAPIGDVSRNAQRDVKDKETSSKKK